MVRLLLFFSAIFLFSLAGIGQVTVSVEPTSFVLTGNPLQPDIAYHIEVTNTSSVTASIYWSKNMTNHPASWTSWICDKSICYGPEFNANPVNKPNVLAPGESFDLQVHMNPDSIEGTADYVLNIIDDLGNILTVINGEFLINNTTGIKENSLSKLTVFPNPATEYFKVSEIPNLKHIELFNIVGNKVRSFDAVPQKQYYVGDLTDGIYLVRLLSTNGKIIKTIRLSKR